MQDVHPDHIHPNEWYGSIDRPISGGLGLDEALDEFEQAQDICDNVWENDDA